MSQTGLISNYWRVKEIGERAQNIQYDALKAALFSKISLISDDFFCMNNSKKPKPFKKKYLCE